MGTSIKRFLMGVFLLAIIGCTGKPVTVGGLLEDLKKEGWNLEIFPISRDKLQKWDAVEGVRLRAGVEVLLLKVRRGVYPEGEVFKEGFNSRSDIGEDSSWRVLMITDQKSQYFNRETFDALHRALKKAYLARKS